jgi:hypothetical protein
MHEDTENNPNSPREIKDWQKTISRMPLTLRPALNQQAAGWDTLFPFEQNMLVAFFRAADSFDPGDLRNLTANLRALELKMKIANSPFTENSDTLENASLLARSAFYAEWRSEVQRVFSTIEARAQADHKNVPLRKRLLVFLFPKSLPMKPQTFSEHWKSHGFEIKLTDDAGRLCNLLLNGGPESPAITKLLTSQGDGDPSNLWLIDAGDWLRTSSSAPNSVAFSSLSFAELKLFRDKFLAQLNTIPRDIGAADQTISALRRTDWTQWCPSVLKNQITLRQFVVNTFLGGNGALIFSNAFVEWSASEALRRARPRAMVLRFGMRSKPKLFTSIAIFENQDKVSTAPDVDDPENSAVDSVILAYYVWLAAQRYSEYEQSLCVCVSEHQNMGWVIAPPESTLAGGARQFTSNELSHLITDWLSTQT